MIKLHNNDNLEILRSMSENSIDAIVTDPPYGLSFMGKKYTEANILGWKIIRIEPDEILKHTTFELLKRALVA